MEGHLGHLRVTEGHGGLGRITQAANSAANSLEPRQWAELFALARALRVGWDAETPKLLPANQQIHYPPTRKKGARPRKLAMDLIRTSATPYTDQFYRGIRWLPDPDLAPPYLRVRRAVMALQIKRKTTRRYRLVLRVALGLGSPATDPESPASDGATLRRLERFAAVEYGDVRPHGRMLWASLELLHVLRQLYETIGMEGLPLINVDVAPETAVGFVPAAVAGARQRPSRQNPHRDVATRMRQGTVHNSSVAPR